MPDIDLDMAKWLDKAGPKEQVKLSDIGINSYQVRYTNVEEKIDEMMDMLESAGGNFQPILLCLAKEGLGFKYDIIYGQRRYTAALKLLEEGNKKFNTIKAEVINEIVPDHIGQAISLQENEGRVPASSKDVAELVTTLRLDYEMTIAQIKEKLGVPQRIVSEVLWREELTPEVRKSAEKHAVKPKIALDVQRRCTVDGVINVKETTKILKGMEVFDDDLRRATLAALNEDKSASIEQAIDMGRKAMSATTIRLTLLKEQYEATSEAAREKDVSVEDYIVDATLSVLKTEKYLK